MFKIHLNASITVDVFEGLLVGKREPPGKLVDECHKESDLVSFQFAHSVFCWLTYKVTVKTLSC